MKIVFIGAVHFSERILKELIRLEANIVAVCTMSDSSVNSDHVDLSSLANYHGIPSQIANDINSQSSIDWIASFSPDVIFCFGWSYLIKKQLLSIPKIGTIGYHPAYLPANRGRHPLIWALVLGLRETASTFFFMDEGADSGDLLSQVPVPITYTDDASSLYESITQVALNQVRQFLPQLTSNSYSRTPQDHAKSNNWRKRGALDGMIDWRMTALAIYNLVRALSHPYVGAHFIFQGEAIKVWRVDVISDAPPNLEPGKVLDVDCAGIVVKAGLGAVRLLDISPDIKPVPGDYL